LMGANDKVDVSTGSETVALLKRYTAQISAAAGWRI
jgi:hypothetical protein